MMSWSLTRNKTVKLTLGVLSIYETRYPRLAGWFAIGGSTFNAGVNSTKIRISFGPGLPGKAI